MFGSHLKLKITNREGKKVCLSLNIAQLSAQPHSIRIPDPRSDIEGGGGDQGAGGNILPRTPYLSLGEKLKEDFSDIQNIY